MKAIVRLGTALVAFAASLVELLTQMVQLLTAIVARASSRLRPAVPAVEVPVPVARRLPKPPTPPPSPDEDRLTNALTGLGFLAAPVRAYVATVRPRLAKEPLEGLVKEGIQALSGPG